MKLEQLQIQKIQKISINRYLQVGNSSLCIFMWTQHVRSQKPRATTPFASASATQPAICSYTVRFTILRRRSVPTLGSASSLSKLPPSNYISYFQKKKKKLDKLHFLYSARINYKMGFAFPEDSLFLGFDSSTQ